MTRVNLLCQIFRIYPEADPGGKGREVAIHFDYTAPQPVLMLPAFEASVHLMLVSMLNGYLICQRDEQVDMNVHEALINLYQALETPCYVHQAPDEMREFVADDPQESSMLLARAGRLN